MLRTSRQWRDLKARLTFGVAFDDDDEGGSKLGRLAWFCPACPQPGVNLPPNWQEDPVQQVNYVLHFYQADNVSRWVYQKTLILDGNFTADHMKMKKPQDDVAFTDGEGYMVQDAPYRQHLKETLEAPAVHFMPFSRSNEVTLLCVEISSLPETSCCTRCKLDSKKCRFNRYRSVCLPPWMFRPPFNC